MLEGWLQPAQHTRALARIELLLTAAREPAFSFMRDARAKLRRALAQWSARQR